MKLLIVALFLAYVACHYLLIPWITAMVDYCLSQFFISVVCISHAISFEQVGGGVSY